MRDRILDPQRKTHAISIVNAHTLNLAAVNSQYHRVLTASDIVYGDGTGVRWAARQRGVTMRSNLVGTDLIPNLFRDKETEGFRCFLLGADAETVEAAREYCKRTFPKWQFVGCHHGYIHDRPCNDVIKLINDSAPDVLLVAMGNPLQETWIHDHKSELDVPVCVGVGGLFDHWAGNLNRAPKWVRNLGIEWLQILLQQPHKWRRYLVGNFAFVARMSRSRNKDISVAEGLTGNA